MQNLSHYINPRQILADKRAYRAVVARTKALPEDYRFAYEKLQRYMWKFASGDGLDMVALQTDLLELFEAGVADGKGVPDIVGADPAAFCDELLANARTYTAAWREELNRDFEERFAG